MEKPDSKGFVTINWPSKNVPFGGVFHNRPVQPSSANQQFLKVLLEESKLTVAQREKSRWENCLRVQGQQQRPSSEEREPLLRPRTSRRRSLYAIRESGIYDTDGYRPLKRGEDREKLKERLQRSMESGDSEQQIPSKAQLPSKPAPKLPTVKETRNELLTQIRERAEWLAEMEVLGEAAPHRDIVKDQIAERIRAIDALGLDSQCSSSRSGYSTKREMEDRRKGSVLSNDNSVRLAVPSGSQKKTTRSAGGVKVENVAAYKDMPKLQYSPRRRC